MRIFEFREDGCLSSTQCITTAPEKKFSHSTIFLRKKCIFYVNIRWLAKKGLNLHLENILQKIRKIKIINP